MDALLALLALVFNLETGEQNPEAFADMDDDALAELRTNIEAAATDAAGGNLTREDIEQLERAATARTLIDTEVTTREGEADELAARRDAALAAIRGEADEDGEGEGDGASGGDGDETTESTEGDGEGDGAETGDGAEGDGEEAPAAPEAVAAAAPPAPARTRPRPVRVPASHAPRASANHGLEGLTASGDVPGMGAGAQFTSIEQLGEKLAEKAQAINSGRGNDDDKFYVARHQRNYPEARRLSETQSADEIRARIEAVTSVEAIVAAGGVCAAPEVDYRITTWGQTNRPVRDALPSFQATRGALSISPSPTLGDIVVDTTAGAIDTVTNAQDIAGSETKTVQTITCGDPVTTYVQARTLGFKGGNFSDRFYPERMRAFVNLGEVAFARDGDKKLLQFIKAGSDNFVNVVAEFGAYRDLKRQVLGTLAELEDQLRDERVRYRVILPSYVPKMLATDLIAQQPGDDAWRITEAAMAADIASWAPNINVTYALDSRRTNGRLLATPSHPAGTADPRTPVFDPDVEWAIFPEGGWIDLDGGFLDLGVVRDSTLNAANRFQTFYEEWEAVAHVAGPSYWVTSSLCAGGRSQVATDVAACGPSGS